ncbi:Pentatricopeptide repeat-containing protein [Glycine soja]
MSQSHKALILIQKMVKVPPIKTLLLFNTASYQGLHHTSHSISFILNHLLSSGMLPQAQSLILRLISGRIPSSLMLQLTQAHFTSCSTYTPLYDAIVNAYVHSHSTDQALTFLHHMIHEGHASLSNTFNNLLCLLIRSNYFDKAWWIFNVLKSKVVLDAYSFGIMITGCCEAGYFVRVFRLLAVLEEFGLSPNVVIYTTLIDGCCKNGDVMLAKNLFCKMDRLGLVPNQHTYSVLMNGFFKQGLQREGFQMYENMNRSGIVPNAYAYNCLISEYCNDGMVDKAFKVFAEMREKGYSKVENLAGALDLVKEMEERRIARSKVTYTILIDAFARLNYTDKACEMHSLMEKSGLVPDVYTYSVLIHGGMVPNVASFCSTMGLLCRDEKWKEAELLLGQMINSGLKPSVSLYKMVHKVKGDV